MKRSNLIALEVRLCRISWDSVYVAEDVDDKVAILTQFNAIKPSMRSQHGYLSDFNIL